MCKTLVKRRKMERIHLNGTRRCPVLEKDIWEFSKKRKQITHDSAQMGRNEKQSISCYRKCVDLCEKA